MLGCIMRLHLLVLIINSMRYRLFPILFLLISVFPATTHASNMTNSLARMDAIITEMQSLRAEFASLAIATSAVSSPTGAVLGAQSTSFFTKSLKEGETNSDIKKIQKLLATDKEIYPYGVSSGMFGPKTGEGIKNFQTRFNLKPTGAVGPATKALLELFIAAYPDDIYPNDVLKKKPTVVKIVPAIPVTPNIPDVQSGEQNTSAQTASTNTLKSITALFDGSEANVKVSFVDGSKKIYLIEGKSKIAIIDALAMKLNQKKATILGTIEFVSSL